MHCADMPDMPDMPDRPDQTRQTRPGQASCGERLFTFTFDFPGDKTRQDKTLVPWTVDGSLVFVATSYRLGRRRGRVPVGWVGDTRSFLIFLGVLF